MKTVFTTGEAAKICKVSQQTIIRCFDSAGDESTTITKESVKKEDCLEDCLDAKRKAGVEITDEVVQGCIDSCKQSDDPKVPDSEKPVDDLPSENSSEKEDCKCSGMSNDITEKPLADKVEDTPVVKSAKKVVCER